MSKSKKRKEKKRTMADRLNAMEAMMDGRRERLDYLEGVVKTAAKNIENVNKVLVEYQNKLQAQEINAIVKGKDGVDRELTAVRKILDIIKDFKPLEQTRMVNYIHSRIVKIGKFDLDDLLGHFSSKWQADRPKPFNK